MSDSPVRFSHLRAYGKSALHGHAARTGPERKPTDAMQVGSAVHALYARHEPVVGYPGKTRQGKEYDAFVIDHPGHIILTAAGFARAEAMAEALRSCELAQPYLQGVRETTIQFRWNGLDCRSTPDIRGTNFITELKTSASSDPARFTWHALRMHYHAQMALQLEACPEAAACRIVCVEAAHPHPVTVFHIQERALEQGGKLLMLWAERLKTCEVSATFPPYSSCVVPLDIPDDDVVLEFGEEEDD